MTTCLSSKYLFQEAINHCRWKTILKNILENINIKDFQNKNFEEIIIEIYNICEKHKGIGLLTIYDITSAICRYYKINIDKVYIIGNGPKRSVKLLNINTKFNKINNKIKIKFVEIHEIINSFDKNNYELDDKIRHCKNGDEIETFICNWQKSR
jgi:hypothetical protein